MSPTNNNQSCDNALGAGLLITSYSTGKFGRLWRRSITAIVFVSRTKTTCFPGEDTTQANDSESLLRPHDESSNPENPVPANGLIISFVSQASKSFSSSANSFKDQGASTVHQGLCRNLSTESRHVIDIPSENDEEVRSTDKQILHDVVARIVKDRDLNSLKEFGGVEKVASIFGSQLENGKGCVQVPGPDIWNTHKTTHYTKGFFHFLLEASNNIKILLLLVAAALSLANGIMEQGPKHGWHEGVAILAAVFMLLTFPSVANVRRARKLEKKLWEVKNKLEVKVVRGGREHLIAVCNIEEGDVVKLAKGDQVPGDGLVLNSNDLALDDVLNSKIDSDRNPFLFFGSKVMEGHGTMLVTSVGGNTELGKGLSSVSLQDPDEKTLLEAQIEKPNAYMENLSLLGSVIIALIAFIRLLSKKHSGDDNGLPDLKGNVSVGMLMNIFERILLKPQGKITILVGALTVVVIAIQHGMPFVITISLSFWNERVLVNQAKPQNLSAVATMGIVSAICIEATGGGVVPNRVEVDKFLIGEKDVNDDAAFEIDQAVLEAIKRGIAASVLVPEISVWPNNDWLVSWAKSRSLNVEFVDRNLSILKYGKLGSENNVCGVLVKNNRGDEEEMMHMHWCGAASTILDMCSQYYNMKGESRAIKDEKRKFQVLIKDMEDSGLKSIAFACGQTEVSEIKEDGLHLLALAGLRYPCPDEIKSTIEALKNAGVRIILVSEDELSVVRDIACELGTFRPDSNDVAIEGEQFRNLNLTERMAKVDWMALMGSCFAEDKLLLVQSVQKKGHVVAFFGGSSNRDTPALKAANVGITEDNRCTELAKESSDIVILAKGSLLPVILLPVMKLGRCAYCNIQKFTQLQLTGCFSGLMITLVPTLSVGESPISSVLLIWVNLIMYTLGGLMMRMEFKDQEPANPPARRTKSLLQKEMWKQIAFQVLCQLFVLLLFQFKGQVIPSMNEDIRKAIIFNSFTLCQVFNQFNAMRLVKKEVLSVVLRNYTFLVALVIVLFMQVLVVEFATRLVRLERLNGMQWGVCFVLAALPGGIHCAANFLSDSFSCMSFLSNG